MDAPGMPPPLGLLEPLWLLDVDPDWLEDGLLGGGLDDDGELLDGLDELGGDGMLGGWLDELLEEQPAASERHRAPKTASARPCDFTIELPE
jgi:hypothetical protein